jgi:hypothetical protein
VPLCIPLHKSLEAQLKESKKNETLLLKEISRLSAVSDMIQRIKNM